MRLLICTTNVMPSATQIRPNASPDRPECPQGGRRHVQRRGNQPGHQKNGLENCDSIRRNLRRHVQKRQALADIPEFLDSKVEFIFRSKGCKIIWTPPYYPEFLSLIHI